MVVVIKIYCALSAELICNFSRVIVYCEVRRRKSRFTDEERYSLRVYKFYVAFRQKYTCTAISLNVDQSRKGVL